MTENEIAIIKRAQTGDKQAFTQLIAEHDKKIFQIVSGMLDNHHDAQDVCQEALIKAFTKIKQYSYNSQFSTWLTRIAINCAMNKRRYNMRKKWLLFFEKDTLNTMAAANDEKRDGFNLGGALQQLSTRQRTVFVLKHMQGYKIKEIADLLQISEGTVKNSLYRAVHKLRQVLKPLFP